MKFIALVFVVLALASQTIGQQNLHTFGSTGVRSNITFNADSIERQDPAGASADSYASVYHLKGNVVIRACCMQRGIAENQPKQAVFMRGDEATYHAESGEIEFRGNTRVTFQNYPQ